MDRHLIVREIGIDAGHRVTHHGSKCRNLHGHRYTVQAECQGPLFDKGEQQGMVLDFGFLKELMMDEIDGPCDHGMILWSQDPVLPLVQQAGGKVYVTDFVPTAENLARHWYERLAPRVRERSDGQATLTGVVVWETPNCFSAYRPEVTR